MSFTFYTYHVLLKAKSCNKLSIVYNNSHFTPIISTYIISNNASMFDCKHGCSRGVNIMVFAEGFDEYDSVNVS